MVYPCPTHAAEVSVQGFTCFLCGTNKLYLCICALQMSSDAFTLPHASAGAAPYSDLNGKICIATHYEQKHPPNFGF